MGAQLTMRRRMTVRPDDSQVLVNFLGFILAHLKFYWGAPPRGDFEVV